MGETKLKRPEWVVTKVLFDANKWNLETVKKWLRTNGLVLGKAISGNRVGGGKDQTQDFYGSGYHYIPQNPSDQRPSLPTATGRKPQETANRLGTQIPGDSRFGYPDKSDTVEHPPNSFLNTVGRASEYNLRDNSRMTPALEPSANEDYTRKPYDDSIDPKKRQQLAKEQVQHGSTETRIVPGDPVSGWGVHPWEQDRMNRELAEDTSTYRKGDTESARRALRKGHAESTADIDTFARLAYREAAKTIGSDTKQVQPSEPEKIQEKPTASWVPDSEPSEDHTAMPTHPHYQRSPENDMRPHYPQNIPAHAGSRHAIEGGKRMERLRDTPAISPDLDPGEVSDLHHYPEHDKAVYNDLGSEVPKSLKEAWHYEETRSEIRNESERLDEDVHETRKANLDTPSVGPKREPFQDPEASMKPRDFPDQDAGIMFIDPVKQMERIYKVRDPTLQNELKPILVNWVKSYGVPSEKAEQLELGGTLEEQIARFGKFTQETGVEFGALVLRTKDGLELSFVQVGEDRSVDLKPMRPLDEDEEILGTFHCVVGSNTLIETDHGPTPISKIKVGENILTADGAYHPVDFYHIHNYKGDYYTIHLDYKMKTNGEVRRISLTSKHPLQIIRNGNPLTIEARDLQLTDQVQMPEYLFNRCLKCDKFTPFKMKYCSHKCRQVERIVTHCLNCGKRMVQKITRPNKTCGSRCHGQYIWKTHPELREKTRQRLAEQMKNPKNLAAIKQGCIERSEHAEYRAKLSEAMKERFKDSTQLEQLYAHGFANEDTQHKAKLALIQARKHGSYWERVVYDYLKTRLQVSSIEQQHPVRGAPQKVSNQFEENCGTRQKLYYLDIALPEWKINIEIDGEAFHNTRQHEDAERDEWLRSQGWTVIRLPVRTVASKAFTGILAQYLPQIQTLADPPITFIPRQILKIEKHHTSKVLVFDIGVKENPSFVAAGILVHNCHPQTSQFSRWDVASFLHDDWEKVSILYAADGSVEVMLKQPSTLKPTGTKDDFAAAVPKDLPNEEIAKEFGFKIWRGSVDDLKETI